MFRLVVIVTLLAGCRISLEDAETPRDFPRCQEDLANAQCVAADAHADLTWIQANIFSPNCGSTICHGGSVEPDLQPGASHGSLVGVSSTTFTDRDLVTPRDIHASFLMFMLGYYPAEMAMPVGATLPQPGGYMPLGLPPLCCQKLRAIERWIDAGAPNN
jgi:hypothetical protein